MARTRIHVGYHNFTQSSLTLEAITISDLSLFHELFLVRFFFSFKFFLVLYCCIFDLIEKISPTFSPLFSEDRQPFRPDNLFYLTSGRLEVYY